MRYLRMNGLGNSILVLDGRGDLAVRPDAGALKALAQHAATRFDQLMLVMDARTPGTDAFVAIYNNDGSTAGACGNGTRCVAHFLFNETGRASQVIETRAGLLAVTGADGKAITVDMGRPRFDWADVPLAEPFADTARIELQIGPIDDPVLHTPAAVSMGNPHAVFFVDADPDGFALERFGPMLENHPIFPERANISLAQVLGGDGIKLRVWERGAGLTLACGTAACATAVSAARRGLAARKVAVHLPGGTLDIVWREDDHVLMTGPFELEAEGTLDRAALEGVPA